MTLTIPAAVTPSGESPPIRVLLADDSAAIRTLARFTLSAKRGFALVGEAVDGADALAKFDEQQPDCVVLDIEMPGMGGFEALAELQRRKPELPVVLLSGYSDVATSQRAKECGAAAYVEKTHGLVALADAVRRVTSDTSLRQKDASTPEQATPPGPEPEEEPPASDAAETTAPETAHLSPTNDHAASDLRRLEYVVSHDFAEPARVINGFATLLNTRYGDSLDDSGRLFVQHLVGGAQRLQAMIDDLLIYSRAGRATVTSEPVDVTAVVTRAVEGLTSFVAERQADVMVGGLPTVMGDAGKLQTVFHHLLLNAITFNTADIPRVQIRGSVVGDTATITFTDNGIGVRPEQCEEVFELFRRLNTREDYPGTGTGLALCKRLVEIQLGNIGLNSSLGGTSVVTITMPVPPVPPN